MGKAMKRLMKEGKSKSKSESKTKHSFSSPSLPSLLLLSSPSLPVHISEVTQYRTRTTTVTTTLNVIKKVNSVKKVDDKKANDKKVDDKKVDDTAKCTEHRNHSTLFSNYILTLSVCIIIFSSIVFAGCGKINYNNTDRNNTTPSITAPSTTNSYNTNPSTCLHEYKVTCLSGGEPRYFNKINSLYSLHSLHTSSNGIRGVDVLVCVHCGITLPVKCLHCECECVGTEMLSSIVVEECNTINSKTINYKIINTIINTITNTLINTH